MYADGLSRGLTTSQIAMEMMAAYSGELNENEKSTYEIQREQAKQLKENRDLEKQRKDNLFNILKTTEENYKDQKKLSEFQKKVNSSQNAQLRDLYKQQEKLQRQQINNANNYKKMQERINRSDNFSIEEKAKLEEHVKEQREKQLKLQDQLIKKQEELNEKIKLQELSDNYDRDLRIKKDQAKGKNTESARYKLKNKDYENDYQKKQLKILAKQEKAIERFQAGTKVLSALGDVLKSLFMSVFNQFFEMWKTEVDNIIDIYEKTYTEVAASTRINQDTYIEWQKDLPKQIKDAGLAAVMKSSEVMEQIPELTKAGISDFGRATDMAFDRVVAKRIAPYVDTMSDAYISLEQKFGTKFTKSIQGMPAYIQESIGSNRVTNKTLDTLVQTLEPVQLAAKKQLLDEDSIAIAEALADSGAMTMSQATDLLYTAANASTDTYGAINEKYGLFPAMSVAQGARDFDEILEGMLNNSNSIFKGIEGSDSLIQGSVIDATGAGFLGERSSISEIMDIYHQAKNKTYKTTGNNEEKSKSAEEAFDDQYRKAVQGDVTTIKQQLENVMAQKAMNVAILGEEHPVAFKAIEDSLGAMGNLLTTILGFLVGGGLLKVLGGGAKLIFSAFKGLLSGGFSALKSVAKFFGRWS